MADDNLIGNELELDSISEITENSYSIGDNITATNFENLVQEDSFQVSVVSFQNTP